MVFPVIYPVQLKENFFLLLILLIIIRTEAIQRLEQHPYPRLHVAKKARDVISKVERRFHLPARQPIELLHIQTRGLP